jgi:hypothetical protein
MGRDPDDQCADGIAQGRAEGGEAVLHARRDDRVDGAFDESITRELAQGEGQHPLADLVARAA